jgi:FkbH-like protein
LSWLPLRVMLPTSYRSQASRVQALEPAVNFARALSENRRTIERGLAEPLAQWGKYSSDFAQLGADRFALREAHALVEYLLNYMRSGKAVWWDLYVGERLKQCHWPADSLEQLLDRRRMVFSADCQYLSRMLKGCADQRTITSLNESFSQVIAAVTNPQLRECHILFVGDCLFLDVVSFLTAPLAAEGIALRPIFLTSKNPSVLRNDLRAASCQKFDLVCYSPYSYEFDLFLSQTHYSRGLVTGVGELNGLVAAAHRQTEGNVRLLSELFECPVCVHNATNFRRHDGSFQSYVKNLTTRRARTIAGSKVSRLLERFIAVHNVGVHQRVVLMDERALLLQHGDLGLGRKFYDSGTFHPTVFSQVLAELYCGVISARVRLFDKKVVVTDLDNTLWSGVIGEGAVEHDHHRQQVLRELRRKGVLLAIASKNDPRKVVWDGASLKESDFVATEINWRSKALNLKLIAEDLNLKLKDFVFLDDRADEREMVKIAAPAVLPLDASSRRTWRMLEWWAAALLEPIGGDRTQLYHERRERRQFMDQAAEQLEAESLLASLQLRLDIKVAPDAALARAMELINRTNQFNTCGTRTTMQEVASWQRSQQHLLLVAEAADKFGNMGLISVMVVQIGTNALEIPVWVLSCRVFGYGIETAMLNHVKRLCRQFGRATVNGAVIETASNDPCRKVYSANGFTWDGNKWIGAAVVEVPDPKWLTIRVDQTANAA